MLVSSTQNSKLSDVRLTISLALTFVETKRLKYIATIALTEKKNPNETPSYHDY